MPDADVSAGAVLTADKASHSLAFGCETQTLRAHACVCALACVAPGTALSRS